MINAELERIVELTGATHVAGAHPKCRCVNGGASCEFRLSWTR
jgi:hypothetical protein